jgi:hypothetical protein
MDYTPIFQEAWTKMANPTDRKSPSWTLTKTKVQDAHNQNWSSQQRVDGNLSGFDWTHCNSDYNKIKKNDEQDCKCFKTLLPAKFWRPEFPVHTYFMMVDELLSSCAIKKKKIRQRESIIFWPYRIKFSNFSFYFIFNISPWIFSSPTLLLWVSRGTQLKIKEEIK